MSKGVERLDDENHNSKGRKTLTHFAEHLLDMVDHVWPDYYSSRSDFIRAAVLAEYQKCLVLREQERKDQEHEQMQQLRR